MILRTQVQSVLLDNAYWNARYFLGLSYQKVGRNADALVQFKILSQVMPDNDDVKKAIDSLSNVQAPAVPVVAPTTTDTTKTPAAKTPAKLPIKAQ
jgi:hypothetical protein